MGCKLMSSITKDRCEYTIAGVKAIYLINHSSKPKYTVDTDGSISAIELEGTDKAYRVEFAANTASFTDDLAVNGNGGKYRTHTLNFTLAGHEYQKLNEQDHLSLGRFTAVVVDKSDKAVVIGRHNGLNATVFNYASGAAEADATGWTVTMAGTERESAPRLKSVDVIETIADKTVVTP